MKTVLLVVALAFTICFVSAASPPYKFGFIHAEYSGGLDTQLPKLVNAFEANYSATVSPLTLLNVNLNNITINDLSGLDAIVVWASATFADTALLGDVLVEYINQGGGVVIALFAQLPYAPHVLQGYVLEGTFDETYQVFVPTNSIRNPTKPDVFSPKDIIWDGHPVIAGLGNLTTHNHPPVNQNLTTGSYIIANYLVGSPMAAAKDDVGPAHVNRVDLGLWPLDGVSYDMDANAYTQLIYQALLYTLDTSYLNPTGSACSMPNFQTAFNQTFGLPTTAVVTQTVPAGTSISGSASVSVTVSVAGSGQTTRQGTVFECSASSLFDSSLFAAVFALFTEAFSFIVSFA